MTPEEMKTRVVMGLKHCLTPNGCPGCPYAGWTKKECINQLIEDALAVLEENNPSADAAGTSSTTACGGGPPSHHNQSCGA